ncbi:MAG: putative transporter, permease protein [Microvirga sp.]|nr:putative transporter, permease protein [Microvirga sp.]
MTMLTSWRALFVREYLEHRIAFQWVPLGIVVLLGLAGLSALALDRVDMAEKVPFLPALKLFEMGYLLLLALWMAYLAVSLFFFFGDAFHADRRNNAMLFWKSMPVTDLKILISKALAGLGMFPLMVFVIGMVAGLIWFLMLNITMYLVPGLFVLSPAEALVSFVQVSLFGIAYYALSLLWYAPFFAWVGGLSTIFGRWSLPLAFVIPGLIIAIENIIQFGSGPRGGYIWTYLASRFDFGFSEADMALMIYGNGSFDPGLHLGRFVGRIDWAQMGLGIAFAAIVIWLASEYRRRRIA